MKREHAALARNVDLVADVLIPPSGAWPAPSTLQLGDDLVGHLRENEAAALSAAVDLLDVEQGFAEMSADERILRLRGLEVREPLMFEVLRRCVYFAYYAQPAVIRLLQEQGYDINESPQPDGYRMDPFTPEIVENVDRARPVWIPADRVGMRLKTAS